MSDDEIEPDDEIDHECTSEVVCPWCGFEQKDIFEYEGIYEDDKPIRVDCQRCERPFESVCSVSHSFSTERVDVQAELAAKQAKQAQIAARVAKARRFPPGSRVRVRDSDRYAAWLRGRVGTVANREISGNGLVLIDLDRVEGAGCFPTTKGIDPDDVVAMEEP